MIALWKIWPELPEHLRPCAGAKTIFGTDFEIWPNISLQWNIISTIGKKHVNLQGHPNMPPNMVNFGPKTPENGWQVFAHPSQFSHWETLPALPHGRYLANDRIADLSPLAAVNKSVRSWPHPSSNTRFHEPTRVRSPDRFSRFCTVHPCNQHTNIETTLRVTTVACKRPHACDAA